MAASSAKRVVRTDAAPRSHDGARTNSGLLNADPTKKYVAVLMSAEANGVEMYESLDYQIEKKKEGGVRFVAGKTVQIGEPLTYRGHVLMSIPKTKAQEQFEDGQAQADLDDKKKALKQGMSDGFRGIRGMNDYLSIENKSKPLDAEMIAQ